MSPGLSALATVTASPGVIRIGHAQSGPPTTADCQKAYKVACYEPGQIQQAYHLPAVYARGVTGKGATIVIVDSYGSPTIKGDLSVFDHTFGLPAPPSFRIIQPAGKLPPYNPNNSDMVGWAGETTLDVEYAHTVAPGANLLVVETPVSETEGVHGFPQIVEAEQYVLNHHLGDVISQSFSATEQTFPNSSALQVLRGAYQPDISMSAACNGSVDTYSTFGGTPAGWSPSCGTSEATPLFAGIVALADQVAGHSLGLINPALYQLSARHAPGITDVTSGNNTVSFRQGGREHTVRGFTARSGYHLASGVGTVNAEYFVPELASLAGH